MRLRVWQHARFSPVGGQSIDIDIQPQSGDVYYFSRAHFGAGANSSTDEDTVAVTALHRNVSMGDNTWYS